jgi:hypothetical protein
VDVPFINITGKVDLIPISRDKEVDDLPVKAKKTSKGLKLNKKKHGDDDEDN